MSLMQRQKLEHHTVAQDGDDAGGIHDPRSTPRSHLGIERPLLIAFACIK